VPNTPYYRRLLAEGSLIKAEVKQVREEKAGTRNEDKSRNEDLKP